MRIVPSKTPKLVQKAFPQFIWDMPPEDRRVYLTFDDGPTPDVTEWVLDLLNAHRAKATFFCIGKNVEQHPDIFRRIRTEGHEVGNHTYSHLKGWNAQKEDYISDTEKAAKFIPSRLFRPPYGKVSRGQAKGLTESGYQIVMWSLLSFDWDQTRNSDDCLNLVLPKLTAGDIVVFHDSVKAFPRLKYVLPRVLDYCMTKEYELSALPTFQND